jgi:hypothetical protein
MSGSKQVLRWLFWACVLSSLVSARTTSSRRRRKKTCQVSVSDTREVKGFDCRELANGVTNSSSESGKSCCHKGFCHTGPECETHIGVLILGVTLAVLGLAYCVFKTWCQSTEADAKSIINSSFGIVASPMNMMQVAVPPGMGPGQILSVASPAPGGAPIQVQIPQGVAAGMMFQFPIPTTVVVAGAPVEVSQRTQPPAAEQGELAMGVSKVAI